MTQGNIDHKIPKTINNEMEIRSTEWIRDEFPPVDKQWVSLEDYNKLLEDYEKVKWD